MTTTVKLDENGKARLEKLQAKLRLISDLKIDQFRLLRELIYFGDNNFEEFLDTRESLIIEKIKNVIGLEESDNNKGLISPKNPFSNRIQFMEMIESCDGIIYWLDKYFSQKGLELLAESLKDSKVGDLRLITSIDIIDEKFRNLFKSFKKEMENRNISCNLRIMIDSKIKS